MTFLWPSMLLSLLTVPLIVLVYLTVQKRRRASMASFEHFGIPQARQERTGLRRHLPPMIFLLGLVLLLIALARPQAEVNLPRVEGTVILVFDVSGSMAAGDAEPTRMEAAKASAREIVQSQPETVQIGVVTFSGNGFTVQNPTNDQNTILTAIDRLQPQTGTSLGQGILAALNTIAVDAGMEPIPLPGPDESDAGQEDNPQQRGPAGEALLAQLPEGPYPPSVIVLLSDGENNQSIDPLEAAQAAADRSVRVDAIGFGTTAGTILEIDGFNIHTALNEAVLQQITMVAGGTYYNPQNTQDAQSIYKNITPQLVVKPETMEVTSLFTGASIVLLLVGAVFSLVWFARLP